MSSLTITNHNLLSSTQAHSRFTRRTLAHVLSFVGLCTMFAWQQASERLYLLHDVVLYNNAATIVVSSVICLLVLVGLGRWLSRLYSKQAILFIAIAGFVSSLVYCFALGEQIRLASFCVQNICATVVMIAWCKRLSWINVRHLISIACTAMLAASLICFIGTITYSLTTQLVLAFLPIVCGAAFFILEFRFPDKKPPSKPVATQIALQSAKPLFAKIKNLPIILIGVLLLCLMINSMFSGLVLNPYVINSEPIAYYQFGLGAFVVAITLLLTSTYKLIKNTTAVSVLLILSIILLVAGLLLFTTDIHQGIVLPLGLVLAASSGLKVAIIIICPRSLNDAAISPATGMATLMLLGAAGFYQYLGIWFNMSIGMSYQALNLTVMVCMAALIMLSFMCLGLYNSKTVANIQPDVDAISRVLKKDMTEENLRETIKKHQRQVFVQHKLTQREQEIAILLALQLSQPAIADELSISINTVKYHCKNVYTKLEVANREEAIVRLNPFSEH